MENRNEEEENKDERTEKVNECPQLVNVIHIYIERETERHTNAR